MLTTPAYKPEEILQIEMVTRTVLSDALGRYIHDPRNMEMIQSILRNGFKDMQVIAPNNPKQGCPPGYSHVDCSCTVNIRKP